MTYKAYFDGSCYNNTCGVGFFILNSSGYIVHKTSRFCGRGDALNAEYTAFILLLQKLVDLKVERVVIYGDSQTVVRQVKGQVNTRKTNRFLPIIRQARTILAQRPCWRVNWIPRRQNGLADALATEGLYSRECA
jgi:ribonuclease HI